MTPEQTRRARTVVEWLVHNEPGRERAESEPAWTAAVTKRIKAERWSDICAAVEANPDLSAATIAQRLAPQQPAPTTEPTAPAVPTYTPDPWQPATTSDKERARRRIAEIRATLPPKAVR